VIRLSRKGGKLLFCAWLTFALTPIFCQVSETKVETRAQTQNAEIDVPKFEIISIKPHRENDDGWSYHFRADGFYAVGITLQYLIKEAYGTYEDYRIFGLPKWTNSAMYDIQAKVAESDVAELRKSTLDQRRMMLQALLVERFNLKAHHEAKVLPEYALVVAKNGPKFRESKPDYVAPSSIKGMGGLIKRRQAGFVAVEWFDMSNVVSLLTSEMDRLVVDRTGLKGHYDFELHWAPDTRPISDTGQPGPAVAQEASGPSIFTALQEQLGLKIESARGPVDVIVIERIETPSKN
jgi:uncharacterized protein (TIGR03435 family)